jgi:protein-S-isoprenylcysteine O-methyltransferase Ste14
MERKQPTGLAIFANVLLLCVSAAVAPTEISVMSAVAMLAILLLSAAALSGWHQHS